MNIRIRNNIIVFIDHGFFVSKLDIIQIEVLDFFGGISKVSKEDYYKATPPSNIGWDGVIDEVDIIDVRLI